MQITDFRNKLYLCGRKIGFTLLFSILLAEGFAQQTLFSKSGGDDKNFSYGFFLAGHTSSLRLKYSDAFIDPGATSILNVRSLMPAYSPGFSLGFLLNTRLHDQINILITPKVGFYEYKTEAEFYVVSDIVDEPPTITTSTFLVEETLVEIPILFKYKSQRYNNTRMYVLAGVNPQIRTKQQDEANEDDIVLSGKDLAVEMGMGFELYFKYFKFSPEIRFSHGLRNLYQEETSNPQIASAISEIRKKSITIYLNFQ